MENGSLWNDFQRSQNYRTETLDYVRFHLGVTNHQSHESVEPSSKIISNFATIGEAIRDVYSIGGCPSKR